MAKAVPKLTDSRNRFVSFRLPYARFLKKEWDRKMIGLSGATGVKYGGLRKVKMIGCAIPIDAAQSLEEWETQCTTPWNPMRKVAWEIRLDRRESPTKKSGT